MATMPTEIDKKYRFDHTDGRTTIATLCKDDEFGILLTESWNESAPDGVRLWTDHHVEHWEGEFTLIVEPVPEKWWIRFGRWLESNLWNRPKEIQERSEVWHPPIGTYQFRERGLESHGLWRRPGYTEPEVVEPEVVELENWNNDPFNEELLTKCFPNKKDQDFVREAFLEPLRKKQREIAKWAPSLLLNALPKIAGELGISKQEAYQRIDPKVLVSIQALFKEDMISSNGREELIKTVIEDPEAYNDIEVIYIYAYENGIVLEKNEDELAAWCDQVIVENEKVANDVRGGKQAAVGRLIGEVMKLSQNKANPKDVRVKLLEKLS